MPVGRSSSVAGSSFMAVRATSATPAPTPGSASGRVTRRSTSAPEEPRDRAASSRAGEDWATAPATDVTASGRNRVA